MILALILLIAIIGGVVQSVIGIGYGMILMGLMSIVLPVKTIAIIILISGFALSFVVIKEYYKYIDFKVVALPLIPLGIGGYIGFRVLESLPDYILKVIMSLFLILIAIWMMMNHDMKVRSIKIFGLTLGFISGLFMGMMSIPGPPLAMYTLKTTKSRQSHVGSIQAIFLIMSFYRLWLFTFSGDIKGSILLYCLAGGVGVSIGAYIGIQKIKIKNKEKYTRFVYSFILFMGVYNLGLSMYTLLR